MKKTVKTEDVVTLPRGVTFNEEVVSESLDREESNIRQITCTTCKLPIRALLIDTYGRYSGRVTIGDDRTIWQGKLPSDPVKSKKQLYAELDQRIRKHLEKCGN